MDNPGPYYAYSSILACGPWAGYAGVRLPPADKILGTCQCGGVIVEAPTSKKARCAKCKRIGRFKEE